MDEKKSWGVVMGLGTLAMSIPFMLFKVINAACNLKKQQALKEKVVVITGASSGIGEALAHVFYKEGCKVVLCARRRDELERVRSDLLQQHSTVPTHLPVVIPLDLSEPDSFEEAVNNIIEVTGHIDYLINNGGISNRGSVLDTQMEVFVRVMTVNYFGTVALTKAVLPHMVKQKQGHIVIVSSVQGLMAIPHRSAYSASKHAMQAFADSLRAELAENNISVTVVSPGYVKTEISMNALSSTGNKHGQMDPTTAKGYSTEYTAKKIYTAVVEGKKEEIIAPLLYQVAILCRTNFPSVYFYIMNRRAKIQN